MLPFIVLIMYFGACVWLLAGALRPAGAPLHGSAHGRYVAGLALAALGWVAHGYALCEAVFRGPVLAINTAAAASIMGWAIAAIAIAGAAWRPRFAVISGLLLLCVGVAAALTFDGAHRFVVEQRGWELTAHILIAVIAYALVSIGAVLALALAVLDTRLRHHQPLGVMRTLPSVEGLEAGMFQAISVGFALLSLTLFSGFIFVQDLWRQHLEHKVILSCLAWLILAVLLIGRWRFGWRGRTAANWALSGFVLLGLAYFGSKIVLEMILGRHWG